MESEALFPGLSRRVAAGEITQAQMDHEMARDILTNPEDYTPRKYPVATKELAAYIIGRCGKNTMRSQAMAQLVNLWSQMTYDAMAYNLKSVEMLLDDMRVLKANDDRPGVIAVEACLAAHDRASDSFNRKLLQQADMCLAIEARERSAGAPSHDGPTKMIAKLPSH